MWTAVIALCALHGLAYRPPEEDDDIKTSQSGRDDMSAMAICGAIKVSLDSVNKTHVAGRQHAGAHGGPIAGTYVFRGEHHGYRPIYHREHGDGVAGVVFYDRIAHSWVFGERVGAPPYNLVAKSDALRPYQVSVKTLWLNSEFNGRHVVPLQIRCTKAPFTENPTPLPTDNPTPLPMCSTVNITGLHQSWPGSGCMGRYDLWARHDGRPVFMNQNTAGACADVVNVLKPDVIENYWKAMYPSGFFAIIAARVQRRVYLFYDALSSSWIVGPVVGDARTVFLKTSSTAQEPDEILQVQAFLCPVTRYRFVSCVSLSGIPLDYRRPPRFNS